MVIAASAPPDRVAALQARLGREAAGALVEQTMAMVAAGLVAQGVRRLVVAGGGDERGSGGGARRAAAGDRRGDRSGRAVDPGGGNGPAMLLALKSGNFGGRDFFLQAFERAPR